MLTHVEKMEAKLSEQNYLSLKEIKEGVRASAEGFYWIYTNLTLGDFKAAPTPKNLPHHIDFKKLSSVHSDLKHVIKPSDSGYWCIYNGKGKQLKNRIVAEFTNTDGKTGKLALLRCFKEDHFRIKYITCGDQDGAYSIRAQYAELEKDLERAWRLHIGWPLLCRV